jgi:16S rRNA (cytosine1402-N4)-methyltransferase
MQIDNPDRGFTFKVPGPLDLRLNPVWGKPAWQLLEGLTRRNLETLLRENADEPHAGVLAKAIDARKGRIKTTTDLAEVIRTVLAAVDLADPEKEVPKTLQRCFQALRIEVNREFAVLDTLLADLPRCLAPGGRVAILTFHSGEETRVRASFAAGLASGLYASVSDEPSRPSSQERYDNPRSKSARLHWAVRS